MNIRKSLVSGIAGVLTAGALLAPYCSYAGEKINLPKLGKVDISSKIIPNGHFTWSEATKGGTRIPNDEKIVDNIITAAKNMEEIRTYFGNKPITITSWYRDPKSNSSVGGAKDSIHMQGLAVDFTVSGVSPSTTYSKMDSYWGARGGVGKYSDFTHVDARGKKARW